MSYHLSTVGPRNSGPGTNGGENQVNDFLFRSHDQGRWPWLVYAAPLVLKTI